MKFSPGQLVWITCDRKDIGIVGRLPGRVIGPATGQWYYTELDDHPPQPEYKCWRSLEKSMEPRDQPKKEDLGEWALCPWRPKEIHVDA